MTESTEFNILSKSKNDNAFVWQMSRKYKYVNFYTVVSGTVKYFKQTQVDYTHYVYKLILNI
jgi:hypothetical protein